MQGDITRSNRVNIIWAHFEVFMKRQGCDGFNHFTSTGKTLAPSLNTI